MAGNVDDSGQADVGGVENIIEADLASKSMVAAMKTWEELRNKVSTTSFVRRLYQEHCTTCMLENTTEDDEYHHVPWDEVELKKHRLLNSVCRRLSGNVARDEFELKKLGLVDSECHHFMTPVLNTSRSPAASMVESRSPAATMVEEKGVKHVPLSEFLKSHPKQKRLKILVGRPSSEGREERAYDPSPVSLCPTLSAAESTEPVTAEIEAADVSEDAEVEKSPESEKQIPVEIQPSPKAPQRNGPAVDRNPDMVWVSQETIDKSGAKIISFKLVPKSQKNEKPMKKEDTGQTML